MKRCLSFSALALLSAIERKYYTQIEPKYSAGSSPIVRISIREDDRGLARNFEDSIVEYLNNGAEIFWTQRRKDLKPPTFEIVSAFYSMFSGSHVYTKYLRKLLPRDYWDEEVNESNREEMKERKRQYKIACDARMEEIKEFNELAKQAMNNISTMESSGQIDLSEPQDKQEFKSTIERMCGFGDIGEIEAVYYTPGPNVNSKSQTKAETISRKDTESNETNLKSDEVHELKNSQRTESEQPVLISTTPANFQENKVKSETGHTNTENRENRIKKEDYEKANDLLVLLNSPQFLLRREIPQLFKAFTTVCEYRIQESTSQIETHYLSSLQDALNSLGSRDSIELIDLYELFCDYKYLFCDCDKCKINKELMKNTDIAEIKNIDADRDEKFHDANRVIYAIGHIKSIEAKDVPLISNSLSIIANYHIDKGTNLEQAHLTRLALDKLRERNKMTRKNLIALLRECLRNPNYVELRDYNRERIADRIKGINESEEERAFREENLNRYKEAMVMIKNLNSIRIEDKSEAFVSSIVVLNYDLQHARNYAESFLVLNTKFESDKIVIDTPNQFELLKILMKTYLEGRKTIRSGQCHNYEEKRAT